MSFTTAFVAPVSRVLSSTIRFPNRMLFASARFISMQDTPRMKVKKIFESDNIVGKNIVVRGWVRTLRDQKNFAFIEVNDGSTLGGFQAVADASIPSFGEIKK